MAMLLVAPVLSYHAPVQHITAMRSSTPRLFLSVESPRLFLESLIPDQQEALTVLPPKLEEDASESRETSLKEAGEALTTEALWPWQLALMGITACWGANFAVTTYALDALGGSPEAGALFIASRFIVAAALMVPFLATASSAGAVIAGVQVGGLCVLGYMAQAMALGMGTSSGTAAFICSLQSVVVALMAARASGVAPRTWGAVALSVAGVGCLELPGVMDGLTPCLGDLVAFGQPLGFGLSYVVLESAMADYPDDELPLAALQCAVIAAAAIGAASVGSHSMPWELPWATLLPDATSSVVHPSAPWGVPAAIAYTGVISTALTIWLTAKVFKKLPSTDASIILASEPLWATGFAAMLLHEPILPSSAVGGILILSALACNEGLCDGMLPGVGQGELDASKRNH